jgi:hypothetical protein
MVADFLLTAARFVSGDEEKGEEKGISPIN